MQSLAVAAVFSAAAACSGGSGGDGDPPMQGTDTEGPPGTSTGGDSSDSGSSDTGEPPPACDPNVGFTPLRRLTRSQYKHAIRDLLGIAAPQVEGFPPDEKVGPFDANALAPAAELTIDKYKAAAEELAATAVADKLDVVLPCDPVADGEGQCAKDFIQAFGRKAFRRPLTENEADRAWELFGYGQSVGDFETGVRLIIQAILQSPHFLYHVELVGEDEVSPLSQFEVASRLSFFMWDSIPDDELLDAAEAGELATRGEVEEQARRMLDNNRARNGIFEFHRQWLAVDTIALLEKDETTFPGFSAELAASMDTEVELFSDYVLREDDGTLETLLTADYTLVDGNLAELYGVPGIGAGQTTYEVVTIDDHPRSGLLTLPAVMSVHAHTNQTSPVFRGKFVRENLMCEPMPTPPPDVDNVPPAVDPDASAKDRYAQHNENPSCKACHALMDPLGFGFEAYDATGRHRTMDGNLPVDDVGEIVGGGDISGEFEGAAELGERLAESDVVRQCVADQWFRFATGRFESEADDCAREEIYVAFEDSGFNVADLIIAVAASDAMRWRRAEPEEEE